MSNSSQRWLARRAKDPYVKQAQAQGLRSRAAFKLQQIQQRDKLIRAGDHVIDLGCAPGGWSQVVEPWVGAKGQVVGCDLLKMAELPNVTFIQGDFTEQATVDALLAACQSAQIDVILSDMAPNTSGVRQADQWQAMGLAEEALEFVKQQLKPGGNFLIKVFQGDGFEAYLKQLRQLFGTVKIRKPDASQAKSREVYLVALNRGCTSTGNSD